MKFPWLSAPQTTVMTTVTMFVTGGVLFRFLVDSLSVTGMGMVFNFGHVDATVYAAILGPVYAAHGWMHSVNCKTEMGDK